MSLELFDLQTDAEALQTSMLLTINGRTEDHAKWVGFVDVARQYNQISKAYHSLTAQRTDSFNVNNMKSPFDTVWPEQKLIFESVYASLLKILGRIRNRTSANVPKVGFDDLLHPEIRASSIANYLSGDYRGAVLNGVLAISDRIRSLTGLDMDGDRLCNAAFSPNNPLLIFSEITSESGKNDQSGFLQIMRGVYQGVRNPKAHSLNHDLDQLKTGQYLVMLSLLMRRVIEAKRTQTQP